MKTRLLLMPVVVALMTASPLIAPTASAQEPVLVEPDNAPPVVDPAPAPAPLVMPTTAPVAAPNPDSDLVGLLKAIHAAIMGKEWGKLLFFIVTLLVWLTRRYIAPRVPALGTSISLMIQTFLWTFSGMLATTWGAGQTPTLADTMSGLQLSFAAAGGWAILKNLLEALAPKFGWAKTLLDFMVPPKADAPAAPTAPAP